MVPHKNERVTALISTVGCLCVVNDQAIADAQGQGTGSTVLANVSSMGRPDGWCGPGCCTAFSRALMPVLAPMPGDVVAYDHWINALADAMGVRRILDAASPNVPAPRWQRVGVGVRGGAA